jgi:hypothetical protein
LECGQVLIGRSSTVQSVLLKTVRALLAERSGGMLP